MGQKTFDEVLGRTGADCRVGWYARNEAFWYFEPDGAFELTEDDITRLRAGDILALVCCGGYNVFVRLNTPVDP